MFESIQPAVQDFVSTVAVGVLGVLSAFLIALAKKGVDWISEKIDAVKDEHTQTVLDNALNNLYTIVNTTVTSLQQTLGDAIKESIANGDGKYTEEDLYALKDKAVEIVKSQLTDAAREALSTVYSDLDEFIKDLIETEVYNLKS